MGSAAQLLVLEERSAGIPSVHHRKQMLFPDTGSLRHYSTI